MTTRFVWLKGTLCTGTLALLLTVLLAQPASAQQSDGSAVRLPQLGHHVFVVSDLVKDPFVKTYVRNSVGIGTVTGYDVPLGIIEGDSIVGIAGDLLYAILEFEYQHKVKDWIAVHGGVRLTGRLGTGVQSLLASGITASSEFELGWLIKLLRSERAMLSGVLNLNNGQITAISLLGFIDDLLAGDQASLVQTTPSLRGSGGFRFAYGVSQLFGFNLSGDVGYGESIDSKAGSAWYYRTGGYASFNFRESTAIPLGVAVGGRIESLPASDNIDDDVAEVLLRIAYTGTDNFSVSMDINYGDLISSTQFEGAGVGTVRFNLRYYF